MMKKLKEYFNKVKIPYYYVPQCPNCKSYITGRYIKASNNYTNDWMLKESLKNGEIIKPVSEIEKDKNCFCLKCDTQFYGDVQMVYMSIEDIEKQKKIRETIGLYNAHMSKLAKNEEEKNKVQGTVVRRITKFIGDL